MDFFGFGQVEGDVRGIHFSNLLNYLEKTKCENWEKTLRKLPLIVKMQKRYIRENYLEGLIEFGVIEFKGKNWFWVGYKALEENEKIIQEKPIEKKIKIVKHKCFNCGKENENRLYCNENCYKEYMLKNRNSE